MYKLAQSLDTDSEDMHVGIGVRIKNFRKKQQLTLGDVAQKTGIPKSTISQIENGNMSPSVAQLLKFAECFQVPFASLFPRDLVAFPQQHGFSEEFVLVLKEHRKPVVPTHTTPNYPGYSHDFLGLFRPSGDVKMFAVTIENIPEDEVQFNSHPGMEFVYIFDGRIRFEAKSEKGDVFHTVLNTEDLLCFPAMHPHAYNAIGKQAKLFAMFYLSAEQKISEADELKQQYSLVNMKGAGV